MDGSKSMNLLLHIAKFNYMTLGSFKKFLSELNKKTYCQSHCLSQGSPHLML